MHLLAVNTLVVRLYCHVFLACNSKATALDLFGLCCVRVRSNDVFYFRRRDLTASSIFEFSPGFLPHVTSPRDSRDLKWICRTCGQTQWKLSTYCKAMGRGPNARPMGVENGSFIEIPGSHQATVFPSVSKRVEDFVITTVPGINIFFDGSESAKPWHKTGRPTHVATTCSINS